MAELTVTVNKLNKRRYIPASLPDQNSIAGIVFKGFIFEGEEVKGVPLPTPESWYKDRDGYFYWGGGVSEIGTKPPEPGIEPAPHDLSNSNWSIRDYEISKIWKFTKGENVKIAIIDTGLNYNHTNINKKKNITYYNIFSQSSSPGDCTDKEGHGTHCAGIIAAHGPKVFGVAPAADLLIIKATINGSMECKNLAIAINQAVRLGANIISISYEFFKSEPDFAQLENAVLNASKENVLIVACTGNSGSLNKFTYTYPASFLTSAGVAASNEQKNLWDQSTLNPDVDILAPGSNIELIGTDSAATLTDSGTSYATPYIAGFCALLLSYSRSLNLDFIRNIMKMKSTNRDELQTQIQNIYGDQALKIQNLGIINPLDTFNAIK